MKTLNTCSLMTIFCTSSAVILTALALIDISHAVNPPRDGGYAGGNTAEGQGALLSLTGGTFKTAVGFFPLKNNTEANFNTAVGAAALFTNSGDKNTGIGAGALLSNTTGIENAATGSFALLNNSTGTENAAFGAKFLKEYRKVENQQAMIAELNANLATVRTKLEVTATKQKKAIQTLAVDLQKVSARLETQSQSGNKIAITQTGAQ